MLTGFEWPSLGLAALGVVGLITVGVIVVFGSRSRLVASQQGQAIDALEARLTAVESENAALKEKEATMRTLLAERDKVISGLQSQLATLSKVVTSKDVIEAFRTETAQSHKSILKAIAGLQPSPAS